MTTIEAIVSGTTYNLTDTVSYPLAIAGTGMSPLTRYTRRGPRQHGTTDTGYRLEPRIMQLLLGSDGTFANLYSRRATLLDIFKPSDNPILMRWTLPDASVRQIDAFYSGGMDFGTNQLFGFSQEFAVELYCPDPTFYDPTQQSVTFTNSGWTGGMSVPLAVPLAVGNSAFDTTTTIAYTGSVATYPTLRITGPITAPTITNTATGEVIPLTVTGAIIAAGDYWDIDLTAGQKTIVDSAGASMIRYLAADNDLATFHLAASPEVASGNNPIKMTGSGVNGLTSLRVQHYRRYIGI